MKTITVAIPLHTCQRCGVDYVRKPWWRILDLGQGTSEGVPAQLKRAGIKIGGTNSRSFDLCSSCEEKGLAEFVCFLCNKNRPSDQVEFSTGDPPEHLCRTCFETVTAKAWDDAVAALTDRHRYDSE